MPGTGSHVSRNAIHVSFKPPTLCESNFSPSCARLWVLMLRNSLWRGAKQGRCILSAEVSVALGPIMLLSRFMSSDEGYPQRGEWRKWIETKLPAKSEGSGESSVETGGVTKHGSEYMETTDAKLAHSDGPCDTRPTASFPESSPIWENEATLYARQERLNFLSEALANEKKDQVDEGQEEEGGGGVAKPKKEALQPLADEITGYAELGQENTPEGILEMPKLHPTRMFFSGTTYAPGDLSPMATSGLTRRRGYQRSVTQYSDEEAMMQADFKNLRFLNNFVSDAGRLTLRSETKLKARVHRHVMRQVKISRQMGLLPYQDRRAEFQRGRKQFESSPVRMGNQVGQQKGP